jgi:hypothetical protein
MSRFRLDEPNNDRNSGRKISVSLFKRNRDKREDAIDPGENKCNVEQGFFHPASGAVNIRAAERAAQSTTGLPLDQNDPDQGKGNDVRCNHHIAGKIHGILSLTLSKDPAQNAKRSQNIINPNPPNVPVNCCRSWSCGQALNWR